MILVNVFRAFYYFFRLIFFCSKQSGYSDFQGIDLLQKDDIEKGNQISHYQNREEEEIIYKENQEREKLLMAKIQALLKAYNEKLGKYNKIIQFVAEEHKKQFSIEELDLDNVVEKSYGFLDKYLVMKELEVQVTEIIKQNSSEKKSVRYYNDRWAFLFASNEDTKYPLLNSSYEQLKLEDELQDQFVKFSLCSDIVQLYGKGDVEAYIVSLFTEEIIEKGLEDNFEEFLRDSDFTQDDLRYTNRVKELIYQKKIELLDQQIQMKKTEIFQIQKESSEGMKNITEEARQIKVTFLESERYQIIMQNKEQRLRHKASKYQNNGAEVAQALEDLGKVNREQLDQVSKVLEELSVLKEQRVRKEGQKEEEMEEMRKENEELIGGLKEKLQKL